MSRKIGHRDQVFGTRRADVTQEQRARGDTEGIVTGLVDEERGEGADTRDGRSHTPNDNRLEVGPGHDLVASRIWCVELDSNAQTANSHRSLSAEALDWSQETPSRHGSQLDLVLVQHGRSTNNTPPIIETLRDHQSLS